MNKLCENWQDCKTKDECLHKGSHFEITQCRDECNRKGGIKGSKCLTMKTQKELRKNG